MEKKQVMELAAEKLSVKDLEKLLKAKDSVVAVQVWTKADLKDALEREGYDSSDKCVELLAGEVKGILSDTDEGLERIYDVVEDMEDQFLGK